MRGSLAATRLEVYETRLMFTGIVSDIGTIEAIEQRGDTRVVVATAYDTATVDLGASIACSGVCLTVVDNRGRGARLVRGRRVGRDDRPAPRGASGSRGAGSTWNAR